jgi:hypothetical protein
LKKTSFYQNLIININNMAKTLGGYKGVTLYEGENLQERIKQIDSSSSTPTATKSESSILSTNKGEQVINDKNKTLDQIQGKSTTTPTNTNVTVDNAGATTQDDYVELFNPTTNQTMKIQGASQKRNQIRNLMESGFEVSESNTQADIPFSSGMSLPTEDDYSDLINQQKNKLKQFTISDEELGGTISNIESNYDARVNAMRDINKNREKSFETLGYRIGARYSGGVRGGVFGGVISEEERQGEQRISKLESEKRAEIAAAKEAARTNNWKVYSQAVSSAEQIYNKQIDAIKDFNKKVEEQNKLIEEEMVKSSQEGAIIDLYKQGITDPIDLYDYLNFDDSGKQIGGISFEDITNITDEITKGGSEGFSQTQLLKLEQAGLDKATRQEKLNFLFGKKGGETTEDIMSYEEFKNSPEAQQLISQREQELQANIPDFRREELLQEAYSSQKSEQLGEITPFKSYTAVNIPTNLKADIIADIEKKPTIGYLYELYPEVSTSYLSSLYNSLTKKSSKSKTTTMTDEEFLNILK